MPTILVVDDSAADRQLIGGRVEMSLDAQVIYAANGKEAIELIPQHWPDLVLTDLMMPEIDGLELVSSVRNEFPFIPVVLITGMESEQIAANALRQGAASYVPKMRIAEDLVETVQRVLTVSREDRQHSQLMHYLIDDQSTFHLRNDLALIQTLVSHIQQMLRCLPLGDETERLRVGIAVEEALKNAYYHGNLEVGLMADGRDRSNYAELAKQRRVESPYCDRRIHVGVRIDRAEAVFVIRDEGAGFETSRLPDESNTNESTGRGVILMRTIMDQVTFNDVGNEVTMIKQRSPDTVEDVYEQGQ